MTDTITRDVVELEELFANELPCGGNIFPAVRPCPHGASAVVVGPRGHEHGHPQAFKCLDCFTDWITGDRVRPGFFYCCGEWWPVAGAYRPL